MMENKNKRSDFSYRYLVDKLAAGETLQREEWRALLEDTDAGHEAYLQKAAETVTARNFGKGVYVRGLIEISSYCRNDCFYCGLRRSNRQALRYRLSADEILACCEEGARLGFATFVLQGGEDGGQGDEWLAAVVGSIKQRFPSCAVTLSVGERPEAAYRLFREAGADRYLLRHETANALHYALLHPKEMSLERRLDCLRGLKALGFQTGAGMMIGSPGQTADSRPPSRLVKTFFPSNCSTQNPFTARPRSGSQPLIWVFPLRVIRRPPPSEKTQSLISGSIHPFSIIHEVILFSICSRSAASMKILFGTKVVLLSLI